MVRNMVKANGLAKLARPLLALTPTTKKKVWGFTPGQTVTKKKETGSMVKQKENTFSHPKKASLLRTSMRTIKKSAKSTPKENSLHKSETAKNS